CWHSLLCRDEPRLHRFHASAPGRRRLEGRAVIRLRSLPRLAIRRMTRNWKLLSSVAMGTLVAAAILSATAIYSDAIRDLGLQHAVEQQDIRALDLRITQTNSPV